MAEVIKTALDFSKYSSFEIPQDYMAFEIVFKHIDQEESDQLEAQYQEDGYKIFHSEMIRVFENKYDLKLIVAKTKGFSF